MTQITWQNIDAPDINEASKILERGSSQLNDALSGLSSLAGQQRTLNIAAQNEVTAQNTAALLDQIRQMDSAQQVQDTSLASLGGQFNDDIDQSKILSALGLRETALRDQERKAVTQAQADTKHALDVRQRNLDYSQDKVLGDITATTNKLDLAEKQRLLKEAEATRALTKLAKISGTELGLQSMNVNASMDDRQVQNSVNLIAANAVASGAIKPEQQAEFMKLLSANAAAQRTITKGEQVIIQQAFAMQDAAHEASIAAIDKNTERRIAELGPASSVNYNVAKSKLDQQADYNSVIQATVKANPNRFGDAVFGMMSDVARGNAIEAQVENTLKEYAASVGIAYSDIPLAVKTEFVRGLLPDTNVIAEVELDPEHTHRMLGNLMAAYSIDLDNYNKRTAIEMEADGQKAELRQQQQTSKMVQNSIQNDPALSSNYARALQINAQEAMKVYNMVAKQHQAEKKDKQAKQLQIAKDYFAAQGNNK